MLEFILSQYETLFDDYMAARSLVPAGNLHEVRYEDLDADPVREMGALYTALGIGGFAEARPRIAEYIAGLGRFKKNAHKPVDPAMRALIRRRWGKSFAAFGYEE